MPNVRLSQMGQTAVNRPFFEIVYNGKRYAAAVNANGKLEIVTPKFLLNLGIYSPVVSQFQTYVDNDLIKQLSLNGSLQTDYTLARFPTPVTLGSGLGFVSDFSPITGWKNLVPSTAFML